MPDQDAQGELERVAETQWNVLRIADLRAAGFSRQQIETMAKRGQVHNRHRGVWTYGHPRLAWQGVLLAAQYAANDSAFLSHETALALNGLRKVYLGEIHVTVVGSRTTVGDPNVRLHRTTAVPELRKNGALRYTAIPRTLLDLAAAGTTVKQLTDHITEAIHQRKLNHAQMLDTLERHYGRPGTKRLAAAYAYYLPRDSSKSGLERSFDQALRARPRIPEPLRNVYIEAGGIDWEIDRYFPHARLAVELDGRPFHSAQQDVERDRVKEAKLATRGIAVLRITDQRWGDEPEDCLDDLEVVLAKDWRWSA
jgi:hypothetical protein